MRRYPQTIAVFAFAISFGCARTTIDNALPPHYPPDDDTAALDFWHNLSERPAISNDEGLHGVLVLMAGHDPTSSYQERLELLRNEGWIPQAFDEPPHLAMQRGTLAKAIVQATGIEGGVMYTLTGARRYADRELVALQILPPGTELQAVSGADFLGIITRAQGNAMLRGVEIGNMSFGQQTQPAESTAHDPPPPPSPLAPTTTEPEIRRTREGGVEWRTMPSGESSQ